MLKVKTVDFVVASYKENLDWLKDVKHNIVLYNKNKDNKIPAIQLENVGRESHTYLYHIINNYDNLAETTIFCQGNPFDHCPKILQIVNFNTLAKMNVAAKKIDKRDWPYTDDFCAIGHLWKYDVKYHMVNKPWDYQCKIPYCVIALETFFPHYKPIYTFNSVWGAIFAVSKDRIRKWPKEKYQILLDYHSQFWSFPWAMESVWPHIFHEPDFPKETF